MAFRKSLTKPGKKKGRGLREKDNVETVISQTVPGRDGHVRALSSGSVGGPFSKNGSQGVLADLRVRKWDVKQAPELARKGARKSDFMKMQRQLTGRGRILWS